MDINIKIIEGVRKFPALHGNNVNMVERNQAWMCLAEKLKMPEQFLKIRWHVLLQEHKQDANFKYANNMSFVCRNTERKTEEENWPEFIITEEYLKADIPDEQEEFVLLEENGDNKKCFKQESPEEKECNLNEKSEKRDCISSKEFEKSNSDISNLKSKIEDDETSSMQYAKQNEDMIEINIKKSMECDISAISTSNVEKKVAAIDVNKNNESCTKDLNEVANQKPQPLITERCEDVIFGELVSAMLKRMDENKKKNIKREIMNLLFS